MNKVNKILGDSAKAATAKMKHQKSNISGGFTSNFLLHGSDVLFSLLASVFRCWLMLLYSYKNQYAWAHWGSARSSQFRNKTRINALAGRLVLLHRLSAPEAPEPWCRRPPGGTLHGCVFLLR